MLVEHRDTLTFAKGSLGRDNLLNLDWSTFRLASAMEMDAKLKSYLHIRTNEGDLLSSLSPFEAYSADKLWQFGHQRLTGPADYYAIKEM